MPHATSVSKEKKEKAPLGAMLHKIWNEVARAEQKWRSEQAKNNQQINRLWGVMQAAFGGSLYKLLMDHPSLSDDDKKFITMMKNIGVEKKFEKKAPEPVIRKPLDPAEIQRRAGAHV